MTVNSVSIHAWVILIAFLAGVGFTAFTDKVFALIQQNAINVLKFIRR